MDNQRESIISPALSVVFAYGLKYLAYGFLTLAVLPTFTATMIIYTTIWGSDLQFLQYLSFILPIDAEGNAHLVADDIMRVFSLLTLVILVFFEAARTIKRRLRPSRGEESGQGIRDILVKYLKPSFIIITIIFVITALILPFSDLAGDTSLTGMYGLVAFFYVMAIVSNAIYTVLNNRAERILGKANSKIRVGRI